MSASGFTFETGQYHEENEEAGPQSIFRVLTERSIGWVGGFALSMWRSTWPGLLPNQRSALSRLKRSLSYADYENPASIVGHQFSQSAGTRALV